MNLADQNTHNDSFEEISAQIQIIERFLKLGKNSRDDSDESIFSENYDRQHHGPNQIFEGHNSHQIQEFERFINLQSIKIFNCKNKQGKKKKKKEQETKKFIPKHEPPQFLLNHHGVNLIVILSEFNLIGCHSKIIFYDKHDLLELKSRMNNLHLLKLLELRLESEGIECQLLCCKTRDTGLKMKCSWIYFHPKPKYKYQSLYSKNAMREMMDKLFDKIVTVGERNIGFSYFSWPGLSEEHKSFCFLNMLLENIRNYVALRKFKLEEVRIFCENYGQYSEFSQSLRTISHEFIKAGLYL